MSKEESFAQQHAFHLLAVATAVILVIGTVVFHHVEKWSFLDSYYYSVVTLSTVGYGDFAPTTPFGRLFATFYIFVGIGIIATFAQTMIKRRGAKMEHRKQSRREKRSSKSDR